MDPCQGKHKRGAAKGEATPSKAASAGAVTFEADEKDVDAITHCKHISMADGSRNGNPHAWINTQGSAQRAYFLVDAGRDLRRGLATPRLTRNGVC